MNDLFVCVDDRIMKIIYIEKRIVSNYGKPWVFVTNDGVFTNKDDIKFIYQCNDCGKLSIPIKNYKKILRPDGERLCSSCCRKGERNGFYNKTHTQETISLIKKTTQKNSKEWWKNDEYRRKVIEGTSKPRRDRFGKEQSERVIKWYKNNPQQRLLRSNKMKQSWKEGKLKPNPHTSNRSKGEIKLFEYLSENLSVSVKEKKTIFIDNTWFLPDIVVNDNIIIEYFGDYWHGNPLKYMENDIVAHKTQAKYVWERDKKRIDILEQNGYNVIIVWSSDNYKKLNLTERIEDLINE